MATPEDRYGYAPITRPNSARWPNGAGLAVYVALGIEHYVFGAGITEDIVPGVPHPDFTNASWRDYGNRVGGFRVLDRCGSLGIPLSILLNTNVYDAAPDLVSACRDAGCAMVAHGRSNSDTLAGMDEAAERTYLESVRDRMLAEGDMPAGWSSPWLAQNAHTLDLLRETGYRYVLDLHPDDRPIRLRTRSGSLLHIPYGIELNDSSTVIGRQASPHEFATMIIDEFDELLAASASQPMVMSIVLHSFISGQPFRLRAVTTALDHIQQHSDSIWLATADEICAGVEQFPGLAV